MTIKTLAVPPLYTPFPTAHHRLDSASIDALVLPELVGIGLLEPDHPLTRSRTGDWAAFCFPTVADDRLLMLAAMSYWSFVWDDATTRGPLVAGPRKAAEAGRVVQSILYPEEPALSDAPWIRGVRHLMTKTRAMSSPTQWQRVADCLVSYIVSDLWCHGLSYGEELPSLYEAMLMRGENSMRSWALGLLPWIYDFELSPSEMNDPIVLVGIRLGGVVVGLDNELSSRYHEVAEKHVNALDVLRHQHQCDDDEAAIRLVRIRDQVMCLYLRAVDLIRDQGTPAQIQTVEAMAPIIRGTTDWGMETMRYTHDLTDPDTGKAAPPMAAPAITYSTTPMAGLDDPPLVAEMAWMWQSLHLKVPA